MVPHPPLIVPEVGRGNEKQVIETFNEELEKNNMKFNDIIIARQNECTEFIEV